MGKDIVPITMFVEDNVPGADTIKAFTHTELPKRQGNNMYIQFLLNYIGGQNNDEWVKMETGFQSGTLPYSVQFGNTSYDWYPSPNNGSTVYVLNYNNPVLSAKEDDWKDAPYNNKFKATFWGLDSQGNTLGAIASQTPLNQLDQTELSIFPFYHVASIIGGSGSDLALYFSGYSQLLQHMMQSSIHSDPPYVEISTQAPSALPTPTP